MAKQSGLHQLRGKVGEFSYYKQTGVSSGLIRSINQGMSARVKTSDEYANVRLNNSEFGQGGRIAAVLGRCITPKFRPMILPFSQSKMAKLILEYIKNDTTAPWGQRNLTETNAGEVQVAALNSVAKNSLDDFGLSINIDEENLELGIDATAQTVNKLAAIGAEGLIIRFLAMSTWIGRFVSNTDRYFPSAPSYNAFEGTFDNITEGADFSITYSLPAAPPQRLPVFAATRTGLLIVMPYRTINEHEYILQEHCTFKAFIIADGPVNY